jgi:serine/threonine protein kinase
MPLIYPQKLRDMQGHGFLDIELNEHMTNICEVLPRARQIAHVGPEQTINGDAWRFLSKSLDPEGGRYIGWSIGELYREGTYGKIYKAHRMVVRRRADGLFDVVEAPHEVIVKRTMPPSGSAVLPVEDVTAHTSEALLHVLAWQTMVKTATPWAIPRPYEVFGEMDGAKEPGWKQMSLCMSYVQGRTLFSHMQRYWLPTTKAENSKTFLEIMAQTAYILHHLQDRLRLNHRDVKVNNIMIRKGSPVVLELGGYSFMSEHELTLIDFGFACVGCPPPARPTTVFQAGSWFPMGELCCKAGRDLAQLIFCIHCYFPVQEYLTAPVVAAVRSWMQIPWTGGIADGLGGFTKEGRPGGSQKPEYNTGIYEFLRRPDVDPATCSPLAIFKACQGLIAN